jgi:hypothetical protein
LGRAPATIVKRGIAKSNEQVKVRDYPLIFDSKSGRDNFKEKVPLIFPVRSKSTVFHRTREDNVSLKLEEVPCFLFLC